jgi:queuosine precursor transporter
MILLSALAAYILVLVGANLLVAHFGPMITPLLGFMLIGFDLSLRDWLHLRISAWQMAGLIGVAGLLTYALNPAAGMIAVASSVAFTTAAVADWATFSRLTGSWMRRANGSNVVGAAVDSLLFPAIAFGLSPAIVPIIAGQFAAKTLGGAMWAYLLRARVAI